MLNRYKLKFYLLFFIATIAGYFFIAQTALAHEAYVLKSAQVEKGLHTYGPNVFYALGDQANARTFLAISLLVGAVLVANLFFQRSRLAKNIENKFIKFSRFGPLIVRLTIATSFFLGATSNSFLGPELSLSALPFGPILRIVLLIISTLILFGLFTRAAALAALIIYSLAFYQFHSYLFTYLNYFGEIIALLVLGSTGPSLDSLFFGSKEVVSRWKKYETAFIRVCYGLALIYAAIDIKILHVSMSLDVIQNYNLTRFHWLFPHDPWLVALGAALAEVVIGLFIVFGFQLRLTVLVSLFYITLSLLFFREMVWPHLLLYGISLNLLFNPEAYSLDYYFDRKWAAKT